MLDGRKSKGDQYYKTVFNLWAVTTKHRLSIVGQHYFLFVVQFHWLLTSYCSTNGDEH
jgi:hypothetical protein